MAAEFESVEHNPYFVGFVSGVAASAVGTAAVVDPSGTDCVGAFALVEHVVAAASTSTKSNTTLEINSRYS